GGVRIALFFLGLLIGFATAAALRVGGFDDEQAKQQEQRSGFYEGVGVHDLVSLSISVEAAPGAGSSKRAGKPNGIGCRTQPLIWFNSLRLCTLWPDSAAARNASGTARSIVVAHQLRRVMLENRGALGRIRVG